MPGDPLLPGAAGFRVVFRAWTGAVDIGRGRLGQDRASHALDIIRLG